MHAEDLYLSLFGRQLQMINPLTDSPIRGDAIMALQSQTSQFVAIDRVLTHEKLRADVLMLHEARWDDIYFEYDTEQEKKAFTHAALQWRCYKGGKYVHALSLIQLSIQSCLQAKIYSHFSAGTHTLFLLTNAVSHSPIFNRSNRNLYVATGCCISARDFPLTLQEENQIFEWALSIVMNASAGEGHPSPRTSRI